ncbi:MAG: aminopeptidase [Candidatus Cloacimonadota bacterium]|nr:aminopeptidase [Candidatus Cloacimonadota bacterium]
MSKEKSKAEKLQKKLAYKKKNFWEDVSEDEKKVALDFSHDYIDYLNKGKTERFVIENTKKILTENDFIEATGSLPKDAESIFRINHKKSLAIVRFGKKNISEGFKLIVAHVDSPRVDFKQVPFYEDPTAKLLMIHTHYYGGIKKYQWMSIPLAICGTVVKEDGTCIEINIGNQADDPVFTFADLLPHLAQSQYKKKIGEAIDSEKLTLLFGSIPYPDEDVKEKIKLNCLAILHDKYGITEEDFISAELEIVPAFAAQDVGLDRSMVGGYGHDDRVCAYTSLKAILDTEAPEYTSIVFLADKEEIGSEGNTGAQSDFIIDFISDVIEHEGLDSAKMLKKVMLNSQILSADVSVGINPAFANVHEKDNAALIGFGVVLTKFTGSRGKGSSNDANAEFVARIRNLFNQNNVCWQSAELGKVDEGGGGTIAKYMANYGPEVIDCGPPVLAMHSPFEIVSKADVFSSYKAYKAFFNN